MRPKPLTVYLMWVLLAVVPAGGAGVCWSLYREMRQVREAIASAEQQLQETERRAEVLRGRLGEVEQLRRELASYDRPMPGRASLTTLFSELSGYFAGLNLDKPDIRTLTAQEAQRYTTVPIEVRFSGGGDDAFEFVKRLERMSRPMQMSRLSMGPDRSEADKVAVDLRLNMFFADRSEAAP